jgi:hypothetical protein
MGQLDGARRLSHSVQWTPRASSVGGRLGGAGRGLAGNCGFGSLARLGGGDLRAFVVVIVIGISGYFMLSGPLAALRVSIFPMLNADGPQGFAQLGQSIIGISPLVTAVIIAVAMIIWALMHKPLRNEPVMLFWGVLAGLSVASAFWGTSVLNNTSFDEVAISGHTFTAPLGATLIYMMTASSGGLGFPIGSVAGVLIGAFIGSMIKGHFRWEPCDDPRELGRQIFGAVLMGFGGVIALGCSVGQGVSAFSTLAYSGPVTLLAIVIGCIVAIRQLLAGFEP